MNDYGIFGEQNILDHLPRMLEGEELREHLECLPTYNENIINLCQANRLMALNDIYRIYLPNDMSIEIYSKLYLAMLRSMQKKNTKNAIKQQNLNMAKNIQADTQGIIGGSDCFTIIGTSGIGKSSAISRAVNLLSEQGIIEFESPYVRIIPCLMIQCPFDCSSKGMLLEILHSIDNCLDTNYYEKALKSKASVDMLIGTTSQILLNHVAILIIDEIQNVVHHKGGRQLVSMLTQLINSSGISICMVGTPEVKPFFTSVSYLARRALGLEYASFEYGEYFKEFCEVLFEYQYVKNKMPLTDEITHWLYEHSAGTLALVVSIFHDAQEISILTGAEQLNISIFTQAYQQRMGMIQGFIQPTITRKVQSKPKKEKVLKIENSLRTEQHLENDKMDNGENISIAELVQIAKSNDIDVVPLLAEHFCIEEVRLT